MRLVWGKKFAYGVGFGVEEWKASEFVAEHLHWVLGKAVCEAAEGFVKGGRLEGVGVFVILAFARGGGWRIVDFHYAR